MSRLARLDRVRVELGGHTVLDDLAFGVKAGHVVGVTGPNGSGKTTLIRVLATLIKVEAGSGEVLGADITTQQIYGIRSSIGLIGHTPAVLPHLSLRENLDHAARLAGIASPRIDTALHTVGLEEVSDRPAESSSFGMKRRLEVARLLLTRPSLLLLDEATSGLDLDARELIDALIARTTQAGGGTVIVSHDPAHLEGRCDEVAHMAMGRLERIP